MRSIEPGTSRFRVWSFGPSRNDNLLLSPAAMQPQPLIRILANPSLDHGSDRLHCALHIDLPGGIAHRLQFLRQFSAEAVAGQADDAHAMHGTLDLPEQAG